MNEFVSFLMNEARHSMDYEHFEDAVIKLQRCLRLENEPENRPVILNSLGYCFLRLGWFEEAVKVYTELLRADPFDNDSRFYLASAYASLKWTGDAIKELRTILASDPNDVLAYHDLALCYRDLGWMKESLEEMKRANAKAIVYGNTAERKVVISSLAHLEYEIENGDEDGSNEVLLFFILLLVINKGRKGKFSKLAKDKAS
jgi:tetratricopeptide (TPR) repeat protein